MSLKQNNNYVKKQSLTIETLKQFKDLENLTDNEAEAIIESLNKLAKISIDLFNQMSNTI